MAEIQDWIKEQLKKGFKKEQIKDGLRSLAKKSKQTKQLVISLILLLMIVIIVWLIVGNYTNKKEEVDGIQKFTPSSYFSLDYPITQEELNTLISSCQFFIGENKSVNDQTAICTLRINKEYNNIYTITSLINATMLEADTYVVISVDLNNLIKKENNNKNISFNACGVSNPVLKDSLAHKSYSNKILSFEEGEVFCIESFQLDKSNFASFVGFIPPNGSFNAKIYEVSDELIDKIIGQSSFLECENILEDYPLLWEINKNISLNYEKLKQDNSRRDIRNE